MVLAEPEILPAGPIIYERVNRTLKDYETVVRGYRFQPIIRVFTNQGMRNIGFDQIRVP